MQDVVLEVQGLSKSYESFKKQAGLAASVKSFFKRDFIRVDAVKDITFKVRRGEFIGFLGPNGAGKTTTLKILAGLIKPSSGSSTAFGQFNTAARESKYLKRIGMVMGQRNQLNPDLPAVESFRLSQSIYDIPTDRFSRRLDQCVNMLSIAEKLLIPVRKLSLGERMKLELILSLLHEPELVFLDEPTIGLDFNAARQIRLFLKEAARDLGITFILTSHYTKDIEELCKRVILINRGSLLYDGALKDVDERLYGQKSLVLVMNEDKAEAAAKTIKSEIQAHHVDIQPASEDSRWREIHIMVASAQAASTMGRVLSLVPADGIIDIRVAEVALDDIFSEIYAQGTTRQMQ